MFNTWALIAFIGCVCALLFMLPRLQRGGTFKRPLHFDGIAAGYAGFYGLVVFHGQWPTAKQVVAGIHAQRLRLIERARPLQAKLLMVGFDADPVSPERTATFLDETLRISSQSAPIPIGDPKDEIHVLSNGFLEPVERVVALANARGNHALAAGLEHWRDDVVNWFCVVTFKYRKLIELGDSTEPWYDTT